MISTGCVGVVPSRKGRLVDLPRVHHCHLVGNQGRQQVSIRHQDWAEFHKLLYCKIPSRIGACAGIGIVGGARLCGSRVLRGSSLWLSRQSLLDGHRIGRVSDVG